MLTSFKIINQYLGVSKFTSKVVKLILTKHMITSSLHYQGGQMSYQVQLTSSLSFMDLGRGNSLQQRCIKRFYRVISRQQWFLHLSGLSWITQIEVTPISISFRSYQLRISRLTPSSTSLTQIHYVIINLPYNTKFLYLLFQKEKSITCNFVLHIWPNYDFIS